jgi:hypothetical protein
MKATSARFASAPVDEATTKLIPDRRREVRVPARYHAIIQLLEGVSSEFQLADISTHGCCVRSGAEGFWIERFVTIAIEEEPLLQAVIRWVHDDTAGMELLHSIPPERGERHELMKMPF